MRHVLCTSVVCVLRSITELAWTYRLSSSRQKSERGRAPVPTAQVSFVSCNGRSSWQRDFCLASEAKHINARGLTFGEACCAPGADRWREISPLKLGQVALRRLKTFFMPVDQGLRWGVTFWIASSATKLKFRFHALALRHCPSRPNTSYSLYILHFEVPLIRCRSVFTLVLVWQIEF